jgi:hypothetical protein
MRQTDRIYERRPTMRFLLVLVLMVAGAAATAHSTDHLAATLYKNPQCDCCDGYADYLRRNSFDVVVKPTEDLAIISRNAGVPEGLEGCHSTFIDGYVIDGHVPIGVVRRLLAERPPIAGITLPGMPAGSPGMGGVKAEPFIVYGLPKGGGAPTVYARD